MQEKQITHGIIILSLQNSSDLSWLLSTKNYNVIKSNIYNIVARKNTVSRYGIIVQQLFRQSSKTGRT